MQDISGQKSALYGDRKQNTFGIPSEIPVAISAEFLCAHRDPHLYSGFHPDPFRFEGDITEKSLRTRPRVHDPLSECNKKNRSKTEVLGPPTTRLGSLISDLINSMCVPAITSYRTVPTAKVGWRH